MNKNHFRCNPATINTLNEFQFIFGLITIQPMNQANIEAIKALFACCIYVENLLFRSLLHIYAWKIQFPRRLRFTQHWTSIIPEEWRLLAVFCLKCSQNHKFAVEKCPSSERLSHWRLNRISSGNSSLDRLAVQFALADHGSHMKAESLWQITIWICAGSFQTRQPLNTRLCNFEDFQWFIIEINTNIIIIPVYRDNGP